MTYYELRDSIEKWSENHDPDFLAQLDSFIKQVENRIVMSVRLPQFSSVGTVSLLPSVTTSSAPADFLAADAVWINGSRPILKKDPEFIYEAYQGATGAPRFYGMIDSRTFIWGPVPDQAYTANLLYFNQPTSICDNKTTGTYISNNFPAALLSGSLWMAAQFCKEAEAAMMYEQSFREALGQSARFTNGPWNKQRFEKKSGSVDGTTELS